MFGFGKKDAGQARRKTKKKTQAREFHWRKSWNWGFLAVPLLAGVVYVAQLGEILPIRSIQLLGSFENLDQSEVESELQAYLGEGFFSLDIHQLQRRLEDKAWTESVSVRRIWPDKIRVTIREKKPVARWDDEQLLSETARVFLADTGDFLHLPVVHAANHDPEWVLRQFYRLQASFEAFDERVVALQVDSRGAFDVELINGLEIKLGRDDIERKIERLAGIYAEQILPRRERIERLDLRYANGFAVAWKQEALQAQDKASLWSNNNV